MRRDNPNQQPQSSPGANHGRLSLHSGSGLVIRQSGGDSEYVEESRKIGELIRFIENVADSVSCGTDGRYDGARELGPLVAFGGDTHSQLQAARDTAAALNQRLRDFNVFLQTEYSDESARRRLMHQNLKESFKSALRRLEAAAEGALIRAHQLQNVEIVDGDHQAYQPRTAVQAGASTGYTAGPSELPYHPLEQSTSPQERSVNAYGRLGDVIESSSSAIGDRSAAVLFNGDDHRRSPPGQHIQNINNNNIANSTTTTGVYNPLLRQQQNFEALGGRGAPTNVSGRNKSPAGFIAPLQTSFYNGTADAPSSMNASAGGSNLTPPRGAFMQTANGHAQGDGSRRNSGLSTAASSYVAIERFARPLVSSADMMDNRILQERRDNLSRLHRDIEGLQELYYEMDTSVDDQGLRISEIETQMSGVRTATQSASEHLTRAAQIRRSRWRLALVAAVLLVSVLLLVDVTRHFIFF